MNTEKMKKKNYNLTNRIAVIMSSLFFFIPFVSFASTIFDNGTQPNGNSYAQFGTVIPSSYVTSTWQSNGFGMKFYNSASATGTMTGWFGYSSLANGPASSTVTWLSSTTRNVSDLQTSFTSWPAINFVSFTSTTNYIIPYGYKYVVKVTINNGSSVSVNNNISSGDILKCVGSTYACVNPSTLAIQVYGIQSQSAVSFTSPTNGATVNDFQNWSLSATGLNIGENYSFQVLYGETTSTIGTYTDVGSGFTVADTVTSGNVLKSLSLIPFSALSTTTVSWSARPALYTSSSVLFGPDITFTVQRNAGFPQQPDWTASSVVNYASSTLAGPLLDCPDFNFFASSTLSTISCYVQKTVIGLVSFLFVPNPNTVQYLADTMTSYQAVFPFNLSIGIVNTMQDQIDTQTEEHQDLTLSIQPALAGQINIDLLKSNGLSEVLSPTVKLWFDNIVLMVVILAFGFLVVKSFT